MTLRNYQISIRSLNEADLQREIPLEFGCTVSDSNNQIENGNPKERELLFTSNGKALKHHVFTNLTCFKKQFPGNPPEYREIEYIISNQLNIALNISFNQVNINVTKK